MKENESISDFNIKLCDIANTCFYLWEKMYEEKLDIKILKSLPKRFDMKIITIEEAQGIIIIKVKELIRSLQTFEIKINDIIEKKTKSIVFVSHTEENEDNCDAEEIVLDVIALIDRKFHEASKRLDRRCKINVVDKVPDNFKNIGP